MHQYELADPVIQVYRACIPMVCIPILCIPILCIPILCTLCIPIPCIPMVYKFLQELSLRIFLRIFF